MGLWGSIKSGVKSGWDSVNGATGGTLGTFLDPLGITPFGEDRVDRANEYGATTRENFDLPGYDEMQGRYDDYLGQIQGREAPQLGQFQNAGFERAAGSQIAGQQQSLADLLSGRARGEGSVAEMQLRQAADQGMAQQAALAAGARPGNSAMAARMAGQNMGRMQAGLGGAAAIARAQEANMAAGQLGGLLGQMRGSDEQMNMFNAGQRNNMNQFNAGQQNTRTGMQGQMDQNQIGMNDAANNALLGQSLSAAQSQQQGGIGYENVQAGKFGAMLGVPTDGEKFAGMAQGLIGALGSDERAKARIAPGGKAADQFLNTLSPQTYEYRKGSNMPGRVRPGMQTFGVMAQDLQGSPMGAQAVGKGPNGMLFLDPQRMSGALAAGLGRVNDRLAMLERGKR